MAPTASNATTASITTTMSRNTTATNGSSVPSTNTTTTTTTTTTQTTNTSSIPTDYTMAATASNATTASITTTMSRNTTATNGSPVPSTDTTTTTTTIIPTTNTDNTMAPTTSNATAASITTTMSRNTTATNGSSVPSSDTTTTTTTIIAPTTNTDNTMAPTTSNATTASITTTMSRNTTATHGSSVPSTVTTTTTTTTITPTTNTSSILTDYTMAPTASNATTASITTTMSRNTTATNGSSVPSTNTTTTTTTTTTQTTNTSSILTDYTMAPTPNNASTVAITTTMSRNTIAANGSSVPSTDTTTTTTTTITPTTNTSSIPTDYTMAATASNVATSANTTRITTTIPATYTSAIPTNNTTTTTITPATNKSSTPTDNTMTPTTSNATTAANIAMVTTATTITTTATTTARTTTSEAIHLLNFTLTINEAFDFLLTNQSSEKYQEYKTTIETFIDDIYRNVIAYEPNSAIVSGFRPGSVIADFTIQATSENINLVSLNREIVKKLSLVRFNVSDSPFSQSVKDKLYGGNGKIYPGTNLSLTCKPNNNGITWTINGNILQPSNKYVFTDLGLTVNNVNSKDSGQYACKITANSMPYVMWQVIKIQPYPNIQVSSDKVVKCEDTTILLQCCVQENYGVEWKNPAACSPTYEIADCLTCMYKINKEDCLRTTNDLIMQFKCQLTSPISESSYNSKSFTITVKNTSFNCSNNVFGAGNQGETQTANCTDEMVGYQVARCNSSNIWDVIEDNCVLLIFHKLKNEAENLQVAAIPQFMARLSGNATLKIQTIIYSPATITTIVDTLRIVSNISPTIIITQPILTAFLKITDVIGSEGARDTWGLLNKNNRTSNVSSELLDLIESLTHRLPNNNLLISTNFTFLSKTIINSPFSGKFGNKLTTQISFPEITAPTFITIIVSSAFNNILPVRNLIYNDSSQSRINGDVVLVETTSTINNISLSFDVKSNKLGNPQCVFWNYTLNVVGGWDSTGCQLNTLGNNMERYTCECNHTTSFSILMSDVSSLNQDLTSALAYITYIGVGISMASLVLCLIIEIIIWKSVTRNDTSFMRHVSIVNIAVSLLIVNICFIIGAAVVKQEGPCSTATFFMHFFYLALFFWMLLSALLLLYRTLMVFSRMTRGAMMGIGFTVGYGAPLIIAVITVASTAGGKGYIQQDYNCWLNWNKTKALLAFVIPALTIVAINLLVLILVLCKRGVNAAVQPDERHTLWVIARCVAILTPLFGLTWGFGIGTLVSPDHNIHIVFAFLNSLQGFLILLFGTLLDSKVREALARKMELRNSIHMVSTSARPSTSSRSFFLQRFRIRNVYNISNNSSLSAASSNSSDASIGRGFIFP